jgi:hypothetical protein
VRRVARGTDLGPVGTDFGAICDQIDQADAMLAGLRERTREGRGTPEPARPDPIDQQPLALARRDQDSRTVTLVLDAAPADIAMFAIAAHADEREAHVREVERFGRTLPEDSYGRRNRQDAAHETRVAARLRAVEQAYRTAVDHDTAYMPPGPTRTDRFLQHQPGKQTDPEAEP